MHENTVWDVVLAGFTITLGVGTLAALISSSREERLALYRLAAFFVASLGWITFGIGILSIGYDRSSWFGAIAMLCGAIGSYRRGGRATFHEMFPTLFGRGARRDQ